jgi:hypothetical protein
MGALGTATTNRLIVPAQVIMMMEKIGELIARGNRITRRKPAPMPLWYNFLRFRRNFRILISKFSFSQFPFSQSLSI